MFERQKFQNETSHDLASLIELPSSALGEPMPVLEMPRRLGARVERTPFAASELEFADQHTIDHVNCPACIAQDEALQGVDVDFATMLFRDAAVYWMNLRRQSTSLKPRAHDATQGNLDALAKFFGALRLCDITPGTSAVTRSAPLRMWFVYAARRYTLGSGKRVTCSSTMRSA